MPYPGIPDNPEIIAKMDRCVDELMAQGKDKSSAIAICHKSIMGNQKEVVDTMSIPSITNPQVLTMVRKKMPMDMDNKDMDGVDEKECPECGCECDPEDNFCPECGHEFEDEEETSDEAKLSYQARKSLKNSDFLYINPKTGKRMFPIQDKSHIRNALARLPQSKLPASVKARLLAKLKGIAKRAGIEVSEASDILDGKILIETVTAPIQLLEAESDGYHRAKFLVTIADEKNANGRIYPFGLIEREAINFQPGDVLGQSRHPIGDPDLLDQFLMWEKMTMDGKKEFAVAKIIPTTKGKDFIEIAKSGAKVSVSRRGSGTVREGAVNGVKGMVVQNDYKLVGIDSLYPNTQSQFGANLMHFEMKNLEDDMTNELTLESLRAEHADLVEAIEKPLNEQLAESKSKLDAVEQRVKALEGELEKAKTLAQEKEVKLDNEIKARDTALQESAAKAKPLEDAVTALTEQVNVLTEKVKVLPHLLEKVQGEKGAWLLLSDLSDAVSPADVDARFADAKKRADALIEGLAKPSGRAVTNGVTETDNDEKGNPITPEQKKAEAGKKTYELSKRLNVRMGMR